MGSRLRGRACAAGAVLPLLILACADDPVGHDGPSPCTPTPGPIFLSSKDDDIADHAWMQDPSGAYHLFFQSENREDGSDVEHYVTTDLQELTYVGVALRNQPDGWDSNALWAPHIVRNGDTYYMFYTGTTGTGPDSEQRIGLATSTDLTTWARYPVNRCPQTSGDGCIYECAEPWTTWGGQPGSHNRQCRDPFVIRDAARGLWVLFATAKSTNGFGVVTVAHSSDLVHWSGAGYVDATGRLADGSGGQSTGGQAENPYVVSHDGTYYLLFTDWQDPEDDCTVQNARTIVQYVTSSTLAADTAGSHNWKYRGYIPDPGVNAIEILVVDRDTWIMSQSIADRTSCDYAEHRRELRLKRLIWGANASFGTSPWAPCADTRASLAAAPRR